MTLSLILLLMLTGCALLATQVQGYCVPESIYSAWTWEARTHQPARIAVSKISAGVDHAQAQGWDGEKWVYLTSQNGWVKQWSKHFSAEPYRYVDLDSWIAEQAKARR